MIGVFDSGIGGLSIFQEIKQRMPQKGVIYLADKGNFPYGEKTKEELLIIAKNAISTLIDYGAKLVVVACNSATIATIEQLRQVFQIPIIAVEPAVKSAANNTKTGKIGVIATKMTVKNHDNAELTQNCEVINCYDANLVSKIENELDNITDEDLRDSMKSFIENSVDSIVLGCTHFYFIKKRLERIYPGIVFYTTEQAVVNQLESVIKKENIVLNDANDVFLVTASGEDFRNFLIRLGIKDADIRKI